MDHVDGTRSGSIADESEIAQQQAGLGSDVLSCLITSGPPRAGTRARMVWAQGFSALTTSEHSLQYFAQHSYFSDIL